MAPIKANPYSRELGVFNQNPWVFHSWNREGVEIYICVCICVCVYVYVCIMFFQMASLAIFKNWHLKHFFIYWLCWVFVATWGFFFFFFPSCNEQGLHSSSSAQASRCGGVSFCGTWASLPHSMWNLPRPGIEPMPSGRLNHWTTREIPGIDIFERMLRGNQNAHHKSSDKAYQKVAFFLFFPKTDFALSPAKLASTKSVKWHIPSFHPLSHSAPPLS